MSILPALFSQIFFRCLILIVTTSAFVKKEMSKMRHLKKIMKPMEVKQGARCPIDLRFPTGMFQRYITIVTDLYPVHIGYKVFEETLKKLNRYLLWLYQILPLLDLEKLPSPVKGHI